MRLRFVRHGELMHNVERFLAGKVGCKGLIPAGIKQAEKLAFYLKNDLYDDHQPATRAALSY